MFDTPIVRLGRKVTVRMIDAERSIQKRQMQTIYSRMLNSNAGKQNPHLESFVVSTNNLRFLNELHSQVESSDSASTALTVCRALKAENQYQAAMRAKVVGELSEVVSYA